MSATWYKRLQGNARGCLLFEPLFLIPYSMYLTYAPIYMLELGVSEFAIGWITSINLAVQLFSSFISGYVTDRMGRRRALLLYDLLSWTAATLLWAVSQNIWFFVVAAVLNGFQKVPNTAFYCLLVEDTSPKERTFVFTLLQLIGVIGGLFAPLGGLLVSHFSLEAGMRVMYAFACVSMTIQFFGRNKLTHETEIGLRKMEEAHRLGLKAGLLDYVQVMRSMLGNGPLMIIFGVYILFNFQTTLKNTFLSIFLVEKMGFSDWVISLFPAVSSIIMLLAMGVLLPRFAENRIHQVMIWGFLISGLSSAVLIWMPAGSLLWLSISTVLGAVGTMMTYPYLEAAVANAIDDEHRAKVFAVLSVLILVFIAPSGIIGGWAYKWNPAVPFVLVLLSFAASTVLMMMFLNRSRRKVS